MWKQRWTLSRKRCHLDNDANNYYKRTDFVGTTPLSGWCWVQMTLNEEMGEALQSAADSNGWSMERMDAEELAELEREYAALGEEGEGADGDVKTLTAQIESEFTIGSEEVETKFPVVPTTSTKPVARKTGTASVNRKAEQSHAV